MQRRPRHFQAIQAATRYRGIAKNQGQLFGLFGLADLVIAKRPLLDAQGAGAS